MLIEEEPNQTTLSNAKKNHSAFYYLEHLPLVAFRNLCMAVFIKDLQSHYLWANDFFIRKSAGYRSVNEIYNKQDYDFSWHQYADELTTNDKILFTTHEPITIRERILRHEGSFIDIISNKSLLYDKQQNLIGLIGFSMELPKSEGLQSLSQREYQAVLLVREGYTDKQIAKHLQISPRTVESHITNAKRKLGVTTRTQLIAKFCRNLS
ncbi:helix-turn-helix domain-containing protein [Legionella cardiaca]|uniref:Helix-turn-helix transcriptional regulator n=1 Tax=Legionella cardiaca TaxID=1071983 RepID=A0ABY8ASR6_9GAMM|nr:helix-turn-helix transcriptional regulator [Legionella cardiaca]WED43558.1 helix-turn-helix transcriptional regulator [Legionella cardiaca]